MSRRRGWPDHWLTDFVVEENDYIDLYFRAAKELGYEAWVGPPYYVEEGYSGFYISRKKKSLQDFWARVRELENEKHKA